MVRIPSFARRSDAAAAEENRDGRIDEQAGQVDRPAADARPVSVGEQVDDRGPRHARHGATAERSDGAETDRADTGHVAGHSADRPRGDRAAVAGTETDRPDRGHDRVVAERPVEVAGPRPRASLLATLGLVLGVTAALLVLTGLLAAYGVAVGVLAVLLSLGGVSATRKRHVAGKSDALLGIAFGLGAIIVGGLALADALPWLTTETDKVAEVRQWLDTQFSERF